MSSAATTTMAACDHHHGVCRGDEADTVCSVEQLARLGEGTHPANTKTLEARFAARFRGRYEELNQIIRRLVAEDDIFGLGDGETPHDIAAAEAELDGRGGGVRHDVEQLARTPDRRTYRFLSSGERHDRFVAWLEDAQERNVLGVVADREGRFIERAYDKGTRNGETFLRRSPLGIPPGVDVATHGPAERRTLERLYTRSHEDARGITADVSRAVSRELTDAYADGIGPREAARRLTGRVDSIGKHQATLMARTNLLEAHNNAAVNTYRMAGVTHVNVIPAADACDDCVALAADNPFLIQNAATLVPGSTHPQCRCTVGPAQTPVSGAAA